MRDDDKSGINDCWDGVQKFVCFAIDDDNLPMARQFWDSASPVVNDRFFVSNLTEKNKAAKRLQEEQLALMIAEKPGEDLIRSSIAATSRTLEQNTLSPEETRILQLLLIGQTVALFGEADVGNQLVPYLNTAILTLNSIDNSDELRDQTRNDIKNIVDSIQRIRGYKDVPDRFALLEQGLRDLIRSNETFIGSTWAQVQACIQLAQGVWKQLVVLRREI